METDMDQSQRENSQSVFMDTGQMDFSTTGGLNDSKRDCSKSKHGRTEAVTLPSMSPGKSEGLQGTGATESATVSGELGLKPSLLDDVLADKKMALMRSPEVMRFLQAEQAKIAREKKMLSADNQTRDGKS